MWRRRRPELLTKTERRVMDATVALYEAFMGLPVEHPDDGRDFVDALHRIQDLVLSRPGRRQLNPALARLARLRGSPWGNGNATAVREAQEAAVGADRINWELWRAYGRGAEAGKALADALQRPPGGVSANVPERSRRGQAPTNAPPAPPPASSPPPPIGHYVPKRERWPWSSGD